VRFLVNVLSSGFGPRVAALLLLFTPFAAGDSIDDELGAWYMIFLISNGQILVGVCRETFSIVVGTTAAIWSSYCYEVALLSRRQRPVSSSLSVWPISPRVNSARPERPLQKTGFIRKP